MGQYINPATEENLLQCGGRKLVTTGLPYEEVLKLLKPTEHRIVMLGDRGMFKFAAVLFSPAEYQEFVKQERALLSYSYWALP